MMLGGAGIKKILIIYDSDKDYAIRLTEYLKKHMKDIEVWCFDDKEAFLNCAEEYTLVPVLAALDKEAIADIKNKERIIQLSDSAEESEDNAVVYKYQTAKNIVQFIIDKEVFCLRANDAAEGIFQEMKTRTLELLDLSRDVSDDELLSVIDNVLSGENIEDGVNTVDREDIKTRIFDSIRRLDILQPLLDDDSITEIMVNGTKHIFIEKEGRLLEYDKSFKTVEGLEEIIRRIVCKVNRVVNEANPIVDARLDDGSRVSVVLPPVAVDGPVLTIRKFDKGVLSMQQLIKNGTVTDEIAKFLGQAVRAGKNIFISGGTSSGKSTFLNALSEFIPAGQRVVVIEDSSELNIKNVKNLVRLEVRNANADGKNSISVRDLIKASLRMRPDRIIVGEVRDGACMDMLQAMLTGHDGSMSTGHGSSPKDMIFRLETMTLMAEALPIAAIRGQIGSALDIIVHMAHFPDGRRRVVSVSEVKGYDREDGEVKLEEIYTYHENNIKD